MEDPVRLPTSGVICDRTSIMRHLLSDKTDPYNRLPLKPDDLITRLDIKEKIDDYKYNKMKK